MRKGFVLLVIALTGFISFSTSYSSVSAGCSGSVQCVQANCISYDSLGKCLRWQCDSTKVVKANSCAGTDATSCNNSESNLANSCTGGCYVGGCTWTSPPTSTPIGSQPSPTKSASNPSPTSSTLLPPRPISPSTTLQCTPDNQYPVTFSWTEARGAETYYLKIDNLLNGWVECGTGTPKPGDFCVPNISTTSYTLKLPSSNSYRWWVHSVSGSKISAASSKLNFKTGPVCSQAYCQLLKAYSTNWVLMDNAQLSLTKAGDSLYYCTNGYTNVGSFDMARFTINGQLLPDTTLVRPNSTDYCQMYTVPANTYNFTVSSELHHVNLGWVK